MKLATAHENELGRTVFGALERLVALAGGRQARTRASRMAYDSGKVRELRRDVNVLNGAEAELRRWGQREKEASQSRGRGCQRARGSIRIGPVPHEVDVRLKSLAARGMVVAGNEREFLLGEVKRLRKGKLEELKKELQQMRWQRAKRWKDALPKIWREAPGRIFAWLKGERTAWGQVPLLGADGTQLTTMESVDRAVQGFWVEKVWRKEKPEEAQASWERFLSSEFAAHIPNVGREWPEPEWTADSVKEVLRTMKKSAAPGMTGIPIGVWLALPGEWHEAVARLLNYVIETGEWPDEATEAYVALIPKGAGGGVGAEAHHGVGAVIQNFCEGSGGRVEVGSAAGAPGGAGDGVQSGLRDEASGAVVE